MLQIFPFLAWIAPATSAVLLAFLWNVGELSSRALAALVGCFLPAGYCQFCSGSGVAAPAGLALQTSLAVYLVYRWRLHGL